ncbi:glycosyltransferase family 2 protein [Nocardia sp. NPDC051030]|uniref:glycosyltransferase n=1 Tax=Nocardia sp. NPDC051030 TaxID=3155162 RepID=UPI00344063E1
MTPTRIRDTAVRAGTAIAVLGTAVALANRIGMRRLRVGAHPVIEPVTVCIPARNEADRLPALIADLRAQQGVPRLRVLILDDASTDDTYAAAQAAIGNDDRFMLAHNDIDPPPGWTGKTAACARLADLAGVGLDETSTRLDDSTEIGPAEGDRPPNAADSAGVIVFLDADVRLHAGALAAAVGELRCARAALVCPWPRQRAESTMERLVQPLLSWSWGSTLPVPLANRSLRPSMAVACGQFLVFDATAYRAVGGHTAVADQVTEDLAIARELRRAGRRTTLVAAGRLAETRMYRSASELEAGYTRWLWSAYGGPAGTLAVGATAALAYWIPPVAALCGRGRIRRIGLLGYAAAVSARLLARNTETGDTPDRTDIVAALAHPLAIAAYLRLSARSHRAHRRGTLSWKERPLTRDI